MTDVPDVTRDTRSVKPRKKGGTEYRVIALSNGTALHEDGTIETEAEVISRLSIDPPTVYVSRNAADFLARADVVHQDNELWNWQASANEREVIHPNGKRIATRVTVVVHWFGFRGIGGKGKQDGVRHLALDPITFSGKRIDDLNPGDEEVTIRLLQWAQQLRDWTYEQGISMRPTSGAIGAQFLRDSRFYPEARRKVPQAINARCRDKLPGNFYRLYARTDHQEFSAIYLDQRRAHHYHARTIRLPHSDTLTARGRFLTLDGDPCIPVSDAFSGLYYCVFTVPCSETQWSPYPDLEGGATVSGFVYSNEVTHLQDSGFTFHGAIASWGSFHYDTGLATYSRWAEEQLNRYGNPAWLKPILLSTYGVLATKPRPVSFMYGKSQKGERSFVHTGKDTLHGQLVKATNGRKLEPGFANVLHRGMIEAATRSESLGFAHYLHHQGHTILSIYADAVLIADDGTDLPLLIEPWSVQQKLTHLQFINTQAFVSAELDKLPGVINRDILKVSRGTVGKAPRKRKEQCAALTGDRIN